MANCSHCRCRKVVPEAHPTAQEPSMHRWPHPVDCAPPGPEDSTAHYIRCALSYQNQLLAETNSLLAAANALLEQIAQNTAVRDTAASS